MIAGSNGLPVPEISAAVPAGSKPVDRERWHHRRIRAAYWLSAVCLVGLFVYGRDYYLSSAIDRALSPKHAYLKPSGTIGLYLGMFGFVLCLLVGLYPLRKRWAWLGRQGSTRHWLDYHGVLGLLAPLVITFHASFKSSGFAGIAYWMMVAVALSGLAGRYLYTQIPSTLNVAELSLKEGQEESARLHAQLTALGIRIDEELESLRAPDVHRAELLSLGAALWQMIVFDILFPLRVWRLRRRLAPVDGGDVERVIALARAEAQLKKKVAFLSKSKRLLHLWHVVHRPFSASFAVFVMIHVVLMLAMGFY